MTSNPRRKNGHRRDRLRLRVFAEEEICWLCGGLVDKSLPHGFPGSAELDEVLPVSKGGDPLLRSNVRLAHRLCNQRRSNRPPGRVASKSAPVAPFKSTRRWAC